MKLNGLKEVNCTNLLSKANTIEEFLHHLKELGDFKKSFVKLVGNGNIELIFKYDEEKEAFIDNIRGYNLIHITDLSLYKKSYFMQVNKISPEEEIKELKRYISDVNQTMEILEISNNNKKEIIKYLVEYIKSNEEKPVIEINLDHDENEMTSEEDTLMDEDIIKSFFKLLDNNKPRVISINRKRKK